MPKRPPPLHSKLYGQSYGGSVPEPVAKGFPRPGNQFCDLGVFWIGPGHGREFTSN
jgi:hypothetical protein